MGRKSAFKLDVVSVRLVRDAPVYSDRPVTTVEDAVELVREELDDMDREMMCVVSLKSDGTPVNCSFASMGALNYAVAHPRELLKSAILSNAAQMLLVHNHPSGSLAPSVHDTEITDRLMRLGELVGIPLADHVIVASGRSGHFSFREKKVVDAPEPGYAKDYRNIKWKEPVAAEKGRCR